MLHIAQVHATLALVEATAALAAEQSTANLIAYKAQGMGGLDLKIEIERRLQL